MPGLWDLTILFLSSYEVGEVDNILPLDSWTNWGSKIWDSLSRAKWLVSSGVLSHIQAGSTENVMFFSAELTKTSREKETTSPPTHTHMHTHTTCTHTYPRWAFKLKFQSTSCKKWQIHPSQGNTNIRAIWTDVQRKKPEHCFPTPNVHRTTWASCWNTDSDSGHLEGERRAYISHKLQGVAMRLLCDPHFTKSNIRAHFNAHGINQIISKTQEIA